MYRDSVFVLRPMRRFMHIIIYMYANEVKQFGKKRRFCLSNTQRRLLTGTIPLRVAGSFVFSCCSAFEVMRLLRIVFIRFLKKYTVVNFLYNLGFRRSVVQNGCFVVFYALNLVYLVYFNQKS